MAKQMDPSRLRKIGQEGFDLLDGLKGQSGRVRRVPEPQAPPPPTQPRVYHQQHYYQQPHAYYVAEPQTWTPVAASNETVHHFHHYIMTSHVVPVQEQHTTPNTTITSDEAAGYYNGFCFVDHGRRSRPFPWP